MAEDRNTSRQDGQMILPKKVLPLRFIWFYTSFGMSEHTFNVKMTSL